MNVQHRSFPAMGTRFDLVLTETPAEIGEILFHEVRSECGRIEKMLSVYREDSALSQVNSLAGKGSVNAGEELLAILKEAREYHWKTGGYFDITLKAVSDYYRETGREVPEDIDFLKSRSGMDKLVTSEGSVRFMSKELKLDLGGYGKGYAMRKIIPVLQKHEVKNALLSFGESLILGWGSHPYGDCWEVELPPVTNQGQGRVIELHDEVLSVSGNSLNNRKKFANSGHILNPLTLRLIRPLGLVAVKSSDPVEGEVYSTALFSAGRDHSEGILKYAGNLEVHWSDSPVES